MNTGTLTYRDLLYIRDLLVADQSARKKETLGRVEIMIDQSPRVPNAESRAAMEEAKNWRSLPSYKTVEEAFASVDDDE